MFSFFCQFWAKNILVNILKIVNRKELKVGYADTTSDHLPYNDFNGVEVNLEPNCGQ